MLDFKEITIEDRALLNGYFYPYGGDSCQHFFPAAFCLKGKYGEKYTIDDDFLFILRENRCTEEERTYMFPLGDTSDTGAVKKAVEAVLQDAHERGKRMRFDVVTEQEKDILAALFGDEFEITETRDMAEYIHSTQKLIELPGKHLRNRRYAVKAFFRDYGESCTVEKMCPDHFNDMLRLQNEWYEKAKDEDHDSQLDHEDDEIKLGLEHFDELGLTGCVIYVEGSLAGFVYGAKVGEDCYDIVAEKGIRSYRHIYPALNHEIAKICQEEYKWINWEEDLGDEGLRTMKMGYKPERMLYKHIVTEKTK